MLTRDNIQDVYPLTELQQGLLFHDLMDQEKTERAYFQQLLLHLHGALDLVAFDTAWNAIIARHDMLRTAFKAMGSEQPLQIVLRKRPITVTAVDLSELAAGEREQAIDAYVKSDRRRGFRIGRDPLVRVACLDLGADDWLVVWSFHHLTVDGWCIGILQQELADAYSQAAAGCAPAPARRPGFGTYVRWLQANPQVLSTQFWRDYLANAAVATVPGLSAATDPARARDHRVLRYTFGEALSESLRGFAQGERATLSTLVQVLWGLLLARLHDVDDVVFGLVTATRPPALPQVGRIVGPFIATLPFRLTLRDAESCAALVRRIQGEMIAWLAHCHAGLGQIRAAGGGAAAFDHFLAVENYPKDRRFGGPAEVFVPGISISQVTPYMPNSYPFSVSVFPDSDITVEFSFNGALIAPEAVGRLWDRLRVLAQVMVDDPTVPARQLSVVLPFETVLLRRWSQGEAPLMVAESLSGMRQAVCAVAAGQPALMSADRLHQGLTHRELQDQAAAMARALRRRGVAAGSTIALMMPAGIGFFTALVAGFELGACVVPVDPGAPVARNRHILQDCGAAAVLVEQPVPAALVPPGMPLLMVAELIAAGRDDADGVLLLPGVRNDIAAYAIYTSGTTGLPKGTRIGPGSLLNYVGWLRQGLGIAAGDRFLLVSSAAFDLAYTGIFGALLLGGSLVIPDADSWKDAERLVALIIDEQITVIKATPSFLQLLLGAANRARLREARTLRLLILGGEAQSFERLRHFRELCPWVLLYNHYGPTEATIGCIAGELSDDLLAAQDPPQRIGRPIAGAEIVLVDRFQLPVAPGAVGEILVGGRCPALGYMPSARAAESRFVRLPAQGDRRFYRTGDYGRWLPDGAIEFLGRHDDEVKIRGYRVDAADVADAIRRSCGYPAAVLVVQGEGPSPLLVAFVATDLDTFDPQRLRLTLSETLPDYMIPTESYAVPALPLTANGKIDREALLALRIQRPTEPSMSVPGSRLEEEVRALFAAVLGTVPATLDDDFFTLGGHSLTAIGLVSSIRRHTGSEFSLTDLFGLRTVRRVAAALEQPRRAATLGTVLVAGGPRHAVFFPPTLGLAVVYRELAARLAPARHCVGFDCPGIFEPQPLPPSFEALADRYADEIRSSTGGGTPLLIGWSMGGLLALATARVLEERQQEVRVVLLDTAIVAPGGCGGTVIRDLPSLMATGGPGAELARRLMDGLDPDSCARIERVATHNDALAAHFAVVSGLRSDILCIEALRNVPPTGMSAVARLTTGAVRIEEIDCEHFDLLELPWLDQVARIIAIWDDQAL